MSEQNSVQTSPSPVLPYAIPLTRIDRAGPDSPTRFSFDPPAAWTRMIGPSIALAFALGVMTIAGLVMMENLMGLRRDTRPGATATIAVLVAAALGGRQLFRLRRATRYARQPIVIEIVGNELHAYDVARWGARPRSMRLERVTDCFATPRLPSADFSGFTLTIPDSRSLRVITLTIRGSTRDVLRTVARLRHAIEEGGHIALPLDD